MYEWGVATDSGGQPRQSPVGVTDGELRARARMLEALGALPDGVPATGWVTVLDFVPSWNTYDRFQTSIVVERDPSGEMQWLGRGARSRWRSGKPASAQPVRIAAGVGCKAGTAGKQEP